MNFSNETAQVAVYLPWMKKNSESGKSTVIAWRRRAYCPSRPFFICLPIRGEHPGTIVGRADDDDTKCKRCIDVSDCSLPVGFKWLLLIYTIRTYYCLSEKNIALSSMKRHIDDSIMIFIRSVLQDKPAFEKGWNLITQEHHLRQNIFLIQVSSLWKT